MKLYGAQVPLEWHWILHFFNAENIFFLISPTLTFFWRLCFFMFKLNICFSFTVFKRIHCQFRSRRLFSCTTAPGKCSVCPSEHLRTPPASTCLWRLALSPGLGLACCLCWFGGWSHCLPFWERSQRALTGSLAYLPQLWVGVCLLCLPLGSGLHSGPATAPGSCSPAWGCAPRLWLPTHTSCLQASACSLLKGFSVLP